MQLVPGFCAEAQNPFTFTTIDQQIPATMFGSTEWTDIDGDGDYDLLQFGNDFDLGVPSLLGYVSRTDRIWFRQLESGIIIQAADHASTELRDTDIWFGSSGWLDADNDGDHDIFAIGTTAGVEPFGGSSFVLTNDNGSFTVTNLGISAPFSGSISTGDFDNDGDADVFASGMNDAGVPTSIVYRNEGGLVFSELASGIEGYAFGDSDVADYDSDGDLDLLISGMSESGSVKTAIYANNGGGSFSLVTDAMEGLLYGSVEWGDFDNDGDLDILSNGGRMNPTILVGVAQVFINNGGAFSPSIPEEIGAAHGRAAFADFDHDGDLDVLVAGGREVVRGRAHGRLYVNDESQSLTHVANIPVPLPATVVIGDYDGDGDVDVSANGLSDRNQPIVLQYENRVRVVNNPPEPPVAGSAQVQGGLVTLTWQQSSDVETPTLGLTYAVRIGSEPGRSDIMLAAAATDDGYRRFASKGNVDQNTSWTVDLPNGTYYWSVQAVDHSYVGSQFSSEGSFTVTESGKGIATTTEEPDGPLVYGLGSPFPNPVRDQATIVYSVPEPVFVSIDVYDALGRRVRTLARANSNVGQSSIEWRVDDDNGASLGTGVYFIRLSSELGEATRSVVVH